MEVNEDRWKMMQDHFGYTDEEMKMFRENPRNTDILSKGPALMNKTIVVEVVESHGCNTQHKVGDKLYFDGAGNLLTKLCPKRVCIYALAAVENEYCSGCHQHVPLNVCAEIMLSHPMFCKSCGRLLYMPEETSPGREATPSK